MEQNNLIKLIVPQLFKKATAFYGNQSFIFAVARVNHFVLSSAISVQCCSIPNRYTAVDILRRAHNNASNNRILTHPIVVFVNKVKHS